MGKAIGFTMQDAIRHAQKNGYTLENPAAPAAPAAPASKTSPRASSTQRRGEMNKTELEFSSRILQPRQDRGEILEWAFEPFSLIYGTGVRYKPDFVVRYEGPITIAELARLATTPAIEMLVDNSLAKSYHRIIPHCGVFEIIEVKGGHIYPEAKPRFNAARLRHQWALFAMWQKKAGEWRQIL